LYPPGVNGGWRSLRRFPPARPPRLRALDMPPRHATPPAHRRLPPRPAQVPWCSSWPFNTVSHPQYVGSVLTVWGMAALVWGQAPAGLGALVLFWTALYVVTGYQEDRLSV